MRTTTAGPVSAPARPIADVDVEAARSGRPASSELDRVLGGGLVPGAVVLLAGEPGVGKSTLLLDVAARFAESRPARSTSPARSPRPRCGCAPTASARCTTTCYLAAETDLAAVLGHIDAVKPDLLVVDSVQTVASAEVDGSPGNVSQVREVAAALIRVAKERGIATVLVGHVTKDGSIAGPRMLEHLVDVVLHFEGDRHSRLRMVRGVKNRFGPSDEVGCFDLADDGIAGLADPSGLFLSQQVEPVPGTCVTVTVEGKRPLVAEVQALVAPSHARQPAAHDQRARLRPRRDGARRAAAALPGQRRRGRRLRLDRRRRAADRAGHRPRGRAGRGRRPRRTRRSPPAWSRSARSVWPARSGGSPASRRRLAEAARLGFTHALVPPDPGRVPPGIEAIEVADLAHGARVAFPGAEVDAVREPPTLSAHRCVDPHGADHVSCRLVTCGSRRDRRRADRLAATTPVEQRYVGERHVAVTERLDGPLRATLAAVAPGTALRDGLERILRGGTGALIVLGYDKIGREPVHRRVRARRGVQLDPAARAGEDGRRHRRRQRLHQDPARRASSWCPTRRSPPTSPAPGTAPPTGSTSRPSSPVISVSQSMSIIAIYVAGQRYVLEDSTQILSRANQALATLERYKLRLDEVSGTLSALEIEDLVTVRDVSAVAQRLEMVRRIAGEIEGYVVELGTDGRLLTLQLDELIAGVEPDRELIARDYLPAATGRRASAPSRTCSTTSTRLDALELLDLAAVARALGYGGGDGLDAAVSPRGYRLLARVPRLPGLVVDRLVEHFGSLQKLLAASIDDLQAVEGVGESRARNVREGLSRLAESSILERYV